MASKSNGKSNGKKKTTEANALANLDIEQLKALLTQNKDLLNELGVTVVAKGIAEAKYSRKAAAERWASGATELSTEERTDVETLPQVIGTGVTFATEADVRDLTQDEIDALMEEELIRRRTEDILKGRYAAIRQSVIEVARLRTDEEFPKTTIASLKHGKKFTVTFTEKVKQPDFEQLQDLISPDVWANITDEVVVREVNPEKLLKALADDTITMEQYAAIVPEKTVTPVLSVRDLKAGDEVI